MNIKRKYVLIGLVLLLIAWMGNVFYYQKHVLKEPLFIKHFYDIKQGMRHFNLYYIKNINSKDDVAYISFPEVDGLNLSSNVNYHNSDRRYYELKILTIIINEGKLEKIPDDLRNRVITKARVHLTNGKEMDVDIGKIYLYCDGAEQSKLKWKSGMGSSDNSGSTSFVSTENLKVYGVKYKFPELKDDVFDININETPLRDIKLPINIKKDDKLEVKYHLKFDDNDIRRNNAYNFSIDILTEDMEGNKGVDSEFANYWLQSPEEYDIDAMIRNGGNN